MTIQPFSNKLHDAFVAGGGRHRFQPALNFVTALQATGQTNFMDCSRQFISKYPQRGLLMVISDFLDDGEFEKPIQYLSDFGHDLVLLQVWADADRTPPWDGELEIQDAETGQLVELAFDKESRAHIPPPLTNTPRMYAAPAVTPPARNSQSSGLWMICGVVLVPLSVFLAASGGH
ncbi:MAG: hypothetical protein WDO18_10505 [Acidobacteriota bacterium]